MQRPSNPKVGQCFRVVEGNSDFNIGEIIKLSQDDGTDCPVFVSLDGEESNFFHWSKLEPLEKTLDKLEEGDILVWPGGAEVEVAGVTGKVVFILEADGREITTYSVFELKRESVTVKGSN